MEMRGLASTCDSALMARLIRQGSRVDTLGPQGREAYEEESGALVAEGRVEEGWYLRGRMAYLSGFPLVCALTASEIDGGEYEHDVIAGWFGGYGPLDSASAWCRYCAGERGTLWYEGPIRPTGAGPVGRGCVVCSCSYCGCGEALEDEGDEDCRACLAASEEAWEEHHPDGTDDDCRDYPDSHTVGPDYWRDEDGEYRCG